MTKHTRLFGFVMAGCFLFFVSVQAFHAHQDVREEEHCSLCQIAHHAPAIANPIHMVQMKIITTQMAVAVLPCLYLPFSAPSHGLSPPLV